MDADYLKKNVNEALTEALASMAVGMPDDKVEYMGRYLLQYVERKTKQAKAKTEAAEAESNYMVLEAHNDTKKTEAALKIDVDAAKVARLGDFINNLGITAQTKQDAMDQVTSFLAEYLSIPAVYIAVKRTVGETETLHYYSASAGQGHVIGKKIVKVVEEGEEAPTRQGISFDAFKIPEPVEEEPPAEGEENPNAPPKPAPRALPLVVDNVMREKRVKFLGIPKLGSYVAVPLSFPSLDHEAGCGAGSGEAGAPAFVQAKVPQALLLGMDSIGQYRSFKVTRRSDFGEFAVFGWMHSIVLLFVYVTLALFSSHPYL